MNKKIHTLNKAPILMVRSFLLNSLVITILFSCKTSIDERIIDLNSYGDSGIEILTDYKKKPTDGVLDSFYIALPEYTSVVYFSTDGRESFLDAANRIFPWSAQDLSSIVASDFKPDPVAKEPSRNGLIALFRTVNNEYLILQGVASPSAMSHLKITDEGLLYVYLVTFGTESVSGNIPFLAYAKGDNIYDVFQQSWKNAISTEALAGRTAMRFEKQYPEMFEYLGWCSWEQYRRKITSDLMVDAMQKIEKSPLQVRWVLVDDGHQHQTGEGMGDSRMLSFNAHPETFPDGFKPVMDLKSEKIKWTGIWHAMNGLWQGLNPDHELEELDPHLVQISKNFKGEPMDVMMPKGDTLSSWLFYKGLIGSASDHGFDFVKIDNQNRQMRFYKGQSNPVEIVSQHAQSLERAAKELSGGLINCFCVDLLSLMNTKYSAVSRVSVDYLLNNEAKAKSHLFQSYQNTLWMGQAVWPDHDMFHSSDKFCGQMMAVSKALSGAPIYLSDAPDDFYEELVTPLCFEDGKLLRPLAPAVPLPESAMISALSEKKAYRVVAPLANGAAAIALYNLTHPSPIDAINTSISASDYNHASSFIQPSVPQWEIPKDGLVYYDWYLRKGGLLDHKYEIDLLGFSDRFIQLSPVIQGWSVVGNPNKYLSAAAVQEISYERDYIKVQLIESGSLVIYNKSKIKSDQADSITSLGNGLWEVDLKEGEKTITLSLLK